MSRSSTGVGRDGERLTVALVQPRAFGCPPAPKICLQQPARRLSARTERMKTRDCAGASPRILLIPHGAEPELCKGRELVLPRRWDGDFSPEKPENCRGTRRAPPPSAGFNVLVSSLFADLVASASDVVRARDWEQEGIRGSTAPWGMGNWIPIPSVAVLIPPVVVPTPSVEVPTPPAAVSGAAPLQAAGSIPSKAPRIPVALSREHPQRALPAPRLRGEGSTESSQHPEATVNYLLKKLRLEPACEVQGSPTLPAQSPSQVLVGLPPVLPSVL